MRARQKLHLQGTFSLRAEKAFIDPSLCTQGTNPSALCDYSGGDPSRAYYDSQGRLCCPIKCTPNDPSDPGCEERMKELFEEKADCPLS
jgi:hypothetical protein